MFILNPDPYSLPSYRIGPFRTIDLSLNHRLPDCDLITEYFQGRFGKKDFIYTENGRRAINIALSYYKLKMDDVVTILTTSGNFYISGCVTKEIEKFCRWSRNMESETRLIFVNHEFGYPYSDLSKLIAYKLPIIEDCAGSFFPFDKNHETGEVGDFVIYSFPKMFPLQIGGLLVSNIKKGIDSRMQVDNINLRYIKNVLSHYIESEEEIKTKRICNLNYLKNLFESLGLSERFQGGKDIVPGVFMFRTGQQEIDLPELKKYFYANGVQCSVFYGEKSFFIPVHQALNEYDLHYFYEIMKSFITKQII